AAATSANAALGTARTYRSAPGGGPAVASTPPRSTAGARGFRPVSAIAAACPGSRQASVTSCPRSASRRAKAVPHAPAPITAALTPGLPVDRKLRFRHSAGARHGLWIVETSSRCRHTSGARHGLWRTAPAAWRTWSGESKPGGTARLRAADEVDGDGNALELEPVPHLVLDPVRVVAGDEGRVVDEEAEARWAGRRLRPVEQVQAPAVARRRLPGRTQLAEGRVQRGRRHAARVLGEQLLDPVQEPGDAPAGRRRHGDDPRPLPQPVLEPGPDVLDLDLPDVPLGQDDDRRAVRLARDVRDGEVLVDQALARVDEDERDVGAVGRVQRAQLGVVLDPLALAPLAAQAGGVDEDEPRPVPLEEGVDRVPGRPRHVRDDHPLLAEDRVQQARLADVRPTEDRDADRLLADLRRAGARQARDHRVEEV